MKIVQNFNITLWSLLNMNGHF